MYVETNEQEMQRLKISKSTGKYGHLESWKELFLFQRYIAKKDQLIEIGNWAKKKNKGERITLPLMNYGNQIEL